MSSFIILLDVSVIYILRFSVHFPCSLFLGVPYGYLLSYPHPFVTLYFVNDFVFIIVKHHDSLLCPCCLYGDYWFYLLEALLYMAPLLIPGLFLPFLLSFLFVNIHNFFTVPVHIGLFTMDFHSGRVSLYIRTYYAFMQA